MTDFRNPLKRPSICCGETSEKFHGPIARLTGSSSGDGLCRGPIVARQHDDANAVSTKTGERRRRRRFDGIGDRDDAGRLAVDGDKYYRCAVAAKRVRSLLQVRSGDAEFLEELRIADRDAAVAYSAGDSLSRKRGEVGDVVNPHAALLGRSDDGSGKRMLA